MNTVSSPSKGARRRANRAEVERMMERVRQALLALTEARLLEIVGTWIEAMLNEECYDGDDDLDECCLQLGYRVVSGATDRSYPTCSAWWDQEAEVEEPQGATLTRVAGDSLHRRIAALSLKDLDRLTEVAFQAKGIEAEVWGTARPPLAPTFFVTLAEELEASRGAAEE
jgi:hypothetical protein